MKDRVYIVSTPIGNLQDFSLRGIETLKNVDFILCEDSRITRKILDYFNIKGIFKIYNDHNANEVIPKIIEQIEKFDKTFALVSDAGTPLVSDPGHKLIRNLIKHQIKFTIVPGANAVLPALILSGFESVRFMFCGFFEEKKIDDLKEIMSTLIFFESPLRVLESLKKMQKVFETRRVAVIREITKIHEEVISGTFEEVIFHFENNKARGEIVIVLSFPEKKQICDDEEIRKLILDLQDKLSIKEISSLISHVKNISRNAAYKVALKYMKGKFDNND